LEHDLHAARAPDFYLDNRMHGSMSPAGENQASRLVRAVQAPPADLTATGQAAAKAQKVLTIIKDGSEDVWTHEFPNEIVEDGYWPYHCTPAAHDQEPFPGADEGSVMTHRQRDHWRIEVEGLPAWRRSGRYLEGPPAEAE
jgi:hypothetical protein